MTGEASDDLLSIGEINELVRLASEYRPKIRSVRWLTRFEPAGSITTMQGLSEDGKWFDMALFHPKVTLGAGDG